MPVCSPIEDTSSFEEKWFDMIFLSYFWSVIRTLKTRVETEWST